MKNQLTKCLMILALVTLNLSANTETVRVNNQPLDTRILNQLSQVYGEIPPGDYWYDPISGLWGVQGGPSTGQIVPFLPLGGPLASDASGGGTGVFVNGREIHIQEYQQLLKIYGQVMPGRYWMNAQFIGGYEGGPVIFNLGATSGTSASGGYNRNTIGGGLMSDGSCSGYLHPGGATVMTGNC